MPRRCLDFASPHEVQQCVASAGVDQVPRVCAHARTGLLRALGPRGLVDAAAVVGLFNAIDRVADATGIPLEAEKARVSVNFRAALGFDCFAVGTHSRSTLEFFRPVIHRLVSRTLCALVKLSELPGEIRLQADAVRERMRAPARYCHDDAAFRITGMVRGEHPRN